MFDDPVNEPVRDNDLVERGGPPPVAVSDPCLMITDVTDDVGAGIIGWPNADRNVTIISRGPPKELEITDQDLSTILLASHFHLARL